MDLPDFGTNILHVLQHIWTCQTLALIFYTCYSIYDFHESTRLQFLHGPGTNLNLSTHVYFSSELS